MCYFYVLFLKSTVCDLIHHKTATTVIKRDGYGHMIEILLGLIC